MFEVINRLFFEEPLRRWHFEAIVKASGISRERVNHFLKKLIAEKFAVKVKPRNKSPYYLANTESIKFRIEKRLYGLQLLEENGLFEYLNSLESIKTAIIFGSFARGDWGKSSDVDLFIYGDVKNFDKWKFESRLKREIQLFSYSSPFEIKSELDKKVIHNIVTGFNIKGNLGPFEVEVNA